MEFYEDEPDYDTDWSQELSAQETGYGDSSSEDAYSDYGDEPAHEEPEPEPPDLCHTTPRYPKPWISWNPSSSRAHSYPTFHPTRKVKYKLFVHNGNGTYGPEFFLFSGLDYLQWEDNMDYYFEYHSTLQEDKLSIALGQLKGSALRWWDQDEYNRWYDQRPKVRTWENLKWHMCAKYSPHSLNQGSQTACPPKQATKEIRHLTPTQI
ncbi:unnamed protein product [Microthlaspi erraticum]|uniref:Retrotransposon gag domain-containing protein n=1 Tax=Microthlaspi erraticum TaxID=1685480 RepID=A0A6D2ILW4_9BRAS|nr:unnamed protein product [Microthlaspi erraticum]